MVWLYLSCRVCMVGIMFSMLVSKRNCIFTSLHSLPTLLSSMELTSALIYLCRCDVSPGTSWCSPPPSPHHCSAWLLKHGGKWGWEADPGWADIRELCPSFHMQRYPSGLQHPHPTPGPRPSGPQKLLFQAQVQGDHLEGQGPVVQTGQAWVPQRV